MRLYCDDRYRETPYRVSYFLISNKKFIEDSSCELTPHFHPNLQQVETRLFNISEALSWNSDFPIAILGVPTNQQMLCDGNPI